MKNAVFGWCTVAFLLFGVCSHARAQNESDPNLANPWAIVDVPRDGYSIAGLVNHQANGGPYQHGIALFPGHPGILRLHEEGGQAAFALKGNFLIRSRRHWLDSEMLIVVIDAPSDQWASFSQDFRTTSRYGEDVAALLHGVSARYGVKEWTAVGTSEGSVSAFHAVRMNPQLFARVILTASVFSRSRNGPGLSDVHWSELATPLLWVHHLDDPCSYTSYRAAEDHAALTKAPLITVRGGEGGRGKSCEAYTAHGFVGVEAPTVGAMKNWVKTGKAVSMVNPANSGDKNE